MRAIDRSHAHAKAVVFHPDAPWIGISDTGSILSCPPFLLRNDGARIPLTHVRDRSGGGWWIAIDSHDDRGRPASSMRREAGDHQIDLGSIRLTIRCEIGHGQDLQAYLDEFRNGLAQLAINASASASSKGHASLLGDRTLADAIGRFARSASNVAAKPASSLSETRGQVPTSRMKHDASSLALLVRRPDARSLSGRMVAETTDTPENRYVAHMLAVVRNVLVSHVAALRDRIARLEADAGQEIRHIDSLETTDRIKVDPKIFDAQIAGLERRKAGKQAPSGAALTSRMAKKASLASSGWIVPLTSRARAEMDQERDASRRRLRRMEARLVGLRSIASSLASLLPHLDRPTSAMKRITSRRSEVLPSSMVFSTNHAYASCLRSYRAVMEAARNAGADLTLMDRVAQVGILHASALYERWCLIRIVSTLVEDFGFSLPTGWENDLVHMILERNSAKLTLSREDVGIRAILHYQKTIKSGRRPDFILEFGHPGRGPRTYLVIDAKFRTTWRPGELGTTMQDLVGNRGYAGLDGTNPVFILHPADNAIADRNVTQAWGAFCDYGHDGRSHLTGSVRATATAQGGSSIDLVRLIGLHLQHSHPFFEHGDDEHRGGIICPSCSASSGITITDHRSGGGRRTWFVSCSQCGHGTKVTHCGKCRRRLFKNLSVLMYHQTVAGEPSNVVCPKCGDHFHN